MPTLTSAQTSVLKSPIMLQVTSYSTQYVNVAAFLYFRLYIFCVSRIFYVSHFPTLQFCAAFSCLAISCTCTAFSAHPPGAIIKESMSEQLTDDVDDAEHESRHRDDGHVAALQVAARRRLTAVQQLIHHLHGSCQSMIYTAFTIRCNIIYTVSSAQFIVKNFN